ncbi:hypothetical protein ZWY2020_014143 [Hordeum vulgare]|nr:hypothetical protein ZWY2020_014143 [Hordeum vulgare]
MTTSRASSPPPPPDPARVPASSRPRWPAAPPPPRAPLPGEGTRPCAPLLAACDLRCPVSVHGGPVRIYNSGDAKDTGSGDVSPSHAGRVRHRRRPNETATDGNRANGAVLLVMTRTSTSLLIRYIFNFVDDWSFVFVVYMGHLYIWAMVVVIQIFMATELLTYSEDQRRNNCQEFRLLNWRFLSRELVNTVTSDHLLYKVVSGLIKYQMFICYFLYIAVGYHSKSLLLVSIQVFVWFILTLKKKTYNYQFKQYAWAHMILLTVLPSPLSPWQIYLKGCSGKPYIYLISLIVINDIAAYLFGFFWRTPLIKLSPKKTWEGFIGASVTTIISAFLWLTCPRKDLSTEWLVCDPGSMFKPEHYFLGNWVPQWFPWKEVFLLPVQWHALALGLFASIIAPFGGFFASGFKRAFKINIPGHGGITDRMDCQMVMAVLHTYITNHLSTYNFSVDTILDQIVKPNLRGAEILVPATWGDLP